MEKSNKTKLTQMMFQEILNGIPNQVEYNDLTDELIDEMLNYSVIRKSVNTLIRGIVSRELIVLSEKNENNDKILEIQKRLNKIKNKNKFIENLALSCFTGRSLHEIIYNDDYTIKEFVEIPKNLFVYNKDIKDHILKTRDKNISLDDDFKWIKTLYNSDLVNLSGQSLLKSILKDFVAIKNIQMKVNYIIEKYGQTVLVFGYGLDENVKDVKATAESLKKANGQNVFAVPLVDGNLRDNIFTLRLSDIDSAMHERLIAKHEKNITNILLGGSLTIDTDGSSSYSLGQIHQEEKEKVEDSIAMFVRDELDKIIDIDATFFGYDSTEYYISIDRPENEIEKIEIEKKRAELQNLKIQGLETLANAGYELDEEEIKSILGVNKITKKEFSLFSE